MKPGTHWTAVYVSELRERAELMRTYNDERGAKIAELHALEIETRAAAYDSEELDIDEAAALSGYHPETLRRLKREEKWSGRRGDLPRHERRSTGPALDTPAPTPGGSLSIADRIVGRDGPPAQLRRKG